MHVRGDCGRGIDGDNEGRVGTKGKEEDGVATVRGWAWFDLEVGLGLGLMLLGESG